MITLPPDEILLACRNGKSSEPANCEAKILVSVNLLI